MRKWISFRRDDTSINTILDLLYGFQRSRTLLTACELDIFSVIGTEYKSAKDISMEINTDELATERLLNALCAMNLLEKVDDKFTNSKLSLRFLVTLKPEYMSIMKQYNYLWDAWSTLTDSIKTGSAIEFTKIQDMDEDRANAYIEAVHWRSSLLAPDIVKMINLSNVKKVLDFGGGIGDYAVEFVNAKSDITADILTYPNVAHFAEENVNYLRMTDKISVKTGIIEKESFGAGYDLVFMSFVLHQNSIWENIELARKAYDCLNKGGQIVIQDYFVNDDRISPEFNTLLSLETLVNTKAGNAYTCSELWIILKEAWFHKIDKKETVFGTGLMFGNK